MPLQKRCIYPKTSAASPIKFYNSFKKYYMRYDILYVGLSSKLSATYSIALQVKRVDPKGERIFLVDSGNVSVVIGVLVLKALKFIESGKSVQEVQELIQEMAYKTNTLFVIDTLEYLQKGGRCSALVRYAAATLRLKPIIKMIDGLLEVIKKPIGYKRGLKAMLADVENDLEKIDQERVYVAYSVPNHYVDYTVKSKEHGF